MKSPENAVVKILKYKYDTWPASKEKKNLQKGKKILCVQFLKIRN